ncbi:MAG TPA: peptidylprolyl isomerase [Gemmatimonadota bacterium]|nr:peptidylprolyl isomerase [Gemmatimonadota bacterium]
MTRRSPVLRVPVALALAVLATAGCASMAGRPPVTPDPTTEPRMSQAPDTFRVKFETSEGDFVVESIREWAPHGVDRFHQLVEDGFYDDTRFFRVLYGFVAQFGISGDPAENQRWRSNPIPDDEGAVSNERGTVTFAMAGPETRTTQLFVNLVDNRRLDGMGFAPIGRVVEGMETVDALHSGYGEGAPRGRGPDQGRIQSEGNAYLDRDYPRLTRLERATIVEPAP